MGEASAELQPEERSKELTPEWRLLREGLTPREAEIALLAARGLSVCAIADRLFVAPGTVKALLARAREKLGCRNVRGLVAILLRDGVLRPEDLLDPREKQWERP